MAAIIRSLGAARAARELASTGRLLPPRGRQLTLGDVSGEWRPTCTVEACGVFAIAWGTAGAERWAPLHDFSLHDQLRLIDACRRSFVSSDDLPPAPSLAATLRLHERLGIPE